MWRRANPGGLALVMGVAVVVLQAGPASAASTEVRASPASGPAGSTFTVRGIGFPAGELEIRWGGQSGVLLTTAAGPEFSVTAVVPDDAIPNSYAVVAVMRDANAVLTSNTSYQVTPAAAEVADTTATTSAAAAVTTTTVAASRTTVSAPTRLGGIDGGLGPSELPASASTGGSAPRAGSTGTTVTTTAVAPVPPGGGTTTTAVPVAAGAAGTTLPPLSARAGATQGDDGESGRALAAQATSQSSGAVRSPGLLVAGLALAFTGVLVMLVRNRHRLRS